jgi:hypothetical protein
MVSVLTRYRPTCSDGPVRRRMCLILTAMIDAGAIMGQCDSELVTENGRWYVGRKAVNPAAARQLLQLGLMRLATVNESQSYELPEATLRRITQLRALGQRSGESLSLDAVCTVLIDEAFARARRRDARVPSRRRASG